MYSMGEEAVLAFSPYEVRDRYFVWLVDRATDGLRFASYNKLLAALYDIDFYSIVDNDDNRAVDGECLREEFANSSAAEYLDPSPIFDRPCSVLEMMIALANRIDDEIMWNPDKGDRSSKWFWEMIRNLGLDDLDDRHFEEKDGYLKVRLVTGALLNRTYSTDGVGSMFPLPGCDKNMRDTEIWYQMNAYMLRNYGIEDEE